MIMPRQPSERDWKFVRELQAPLTCIIYKLRCVVFKQLMCFPCLFAAACGYYYNDNGG